MVHLPSRDPQDVAPEEIFSSSFAAAAYLEQTKFKDTGRKVQYPERVPAACLKPESKLLMSIEVVGLWHERAVHLVPFSSISKKIYTCHCDGLVWQCRWASEWHG